MLLTSRPDRWSALLAAPGDLALGPDEDLGLVRPLARFSGTSGGEDLRRAPDDDCPLRLAEDADRDVRVADEVLELAGVGLGLEPEVVTLEPDHDRGGMGTAIGCDRREHARG